MSTFLLIVSIGFLFISLLALFFSATHAIAIGVVSLVVGLYSFIIQYDDVQKRKQEKEII